MQETRLTEHKSWRLWRQSRNNQSGSFLMLKTAPISHGPKERDEHNLLVVSMLFGWFLRCWKMTKGLIHRDHLAGSIPVLRIEKEMVTPWQ